MPSDDDKYHVSLPRYLYEQLQEYVALENKTISEAVEAFITDGLKGHASARHTRTGDRRAHPHGETDAASLRGD